jgi:hypothetical protein
MGSVPLQHFHSVPYNEVLPCSWLHYRPESGCFLSLLLISWWEGALPSWWHKKIDHLWLCELFWSPTFPFLTPSQVAQLLSYTMSSASSHILIGMRSFVGHLLGLFGRPLNLKHWTPFYSIIWPSHSIIGH